MWSWQQRRQWPGDIVGRGPFRGKKTSCGWHRMRRRPRREQAPGYSKLRGRSSKRRRTTTYGSWCPACIAGRVHMRRVSDPMRSGRRTLALHTGARSTPAGDVALLLPGRIRSGLPTKREPKATLHDGAAQLTKGQDVRPVVPLLSWPDQHRESSWGAQREHCVHAPWKATRDCQAPASLSALRLGAVSPRPAATAEPRARAPPGAGSAKDSRTGCSSGSANGGERTTCFAATEANSVGTGRREQPSPTTSRQGSSLATGICMPDNPQAPARHDHALAAHVSSCVLGAAFACGPWSISPRALSCAGAADGVDLRLRDSACLPRLSVHGRSHGAPRIHPSWRTRHLE